MKPAVALDPWHALRALTPARIALGRCGASLPTEELLRFGIAHAQARDAVHLPFDVDDVARQATALGIDSVVVESAATDRATYLRRPDLGRRLSERSAALLAALPHHDDAAPRLACVIGDGLSSAAVHAHALPLLRELRPLLEACGFALAEPLVLARQARVALGDEIGAALKAQAVAMLIGERPGLSSPDSLGVYLTWAPRIGRVDAERNCISNIRPAGLDAAGAAHKLAWLLDAARRLGTTGIALKDESALPGLAARRDVASWPTPDEGAGR